MDPNDSSAADLELSERLRPLVNEILGRFNEEKIGPKEAGTVIIALLHRLLEVLDDAPEAQRHIAIAVVQLINQHLEGTLKKSSPGSCPLC
jgi:hypothetical protein